MTQTQTILAQLYMSFQKIYPVTGVLLVVVQDAGTNKVPTSMKTISTLGASPIGYPFKMRIIIKLFLK